MSDKYEALSQLRIAKQCPARWSHMAGDDQVRHCGKCDRNVYNLTEMTRDEALRVIEAHEGRLCTRFYSRSDGTIMTKDCGFIPRLGMKVSLALGSVLALVGFVMPATYSTGKIASSRSTLSRSAARRLAIDLADLKSGEKLDPESLKQIKERLTYCAEPSERLNP